MTNKKDIGKLYKEQLQELKASPRDHVWEQIAASLDEAPKRRAAYWKYLVGLMLLLFLPLGGGILYYSLDHNASKEPPTNSILLEPGTAPQDSENANETSFSKSELKVPATKSNANKGDTPPKNASNANYIPSNTGQNTSKSKPSTIPKTKTQLQHESNTTFRTSTKAAHERYTSDLIAVTSTDSKEAPKLSSYPIVWVGALENDRPKWFQLGPSKKKKHRKKHIELDVEPYAGMTLFGSLKKGSAIDETLNNHSRSSTLTARYGLTVRYNFNKRSSVSFGFGHTRLAHTTDNALQTDGNGLILGLTNLHTVVPSQGAISNAFGTNASIDLRQELSYVELPFQYTYKPIIGTWNLRVYGGASFLILTKNSMIAESSNGFSARIGESNNVSTTHFSFNIGAGLGYIISDRIQLNFEPTFRYHIRTFNQTHAFRPYSLSAQIGASYRFKF